MNVIADIGGLWKPFENLLSQMPKQKTILLGDLNDRGQNTKEVITLAKQKQEETPNEFIVLDSNHGDMFIDWYRLHTEPNYKARYEHGVFFHNGGFATICSYDEKASEMLYVPKTITKEYVESIPLLKEHIHWLASLPSHHVEVVNGQRYFFSHAPIKTELPLVYFLSKNNNYMGIENAFSDYNYQWNRYEPHKFHEELPNTINVFGHNSYEYPKLICKSYKNGIYVKSDDHLQNLMEHEKGSIYGIAMDTSRGDFMYGLDLNELKLYASYKGV